MGFPNFYFLHFDCSCIMEWHCCGLSKDGPGTRFLHDEMNTLYASVCIFYNRHLEVLFTRPRSMDNMRKSKSTFPVDVRLTSKIRLCIIHLKSRFVFDKVVAWHWKQIAFWASMSLCLPTLMYGLFETIESRWVPILERRKSCKCWQWCVMI